MDGLVASGTLFHLAALLLVAGVLITRPRTVRLLLTLSGALALAQLVLGGFGVGWIVWAVIFTAINGVHFMALLSRARSGKLLEEERALFDEVMKIGEPGHQKHLKDLIDWRDIQPGEALVRQGDPRPPLIYVARGHAEIAVDGSRVGRCAPGDFLGEMALISGQTASATVTASEEMRVARFDREALAQLSRFAPDVGRALDAALNRSLAAKVIRMNEVAKSRGETTAV